MYQNKNNYNNNNNFKSQGKRFYNNDQEQTTYSKPQGRDQQDDYRPKSTYNQNGGYQNGGY